MPPLTPLLTPLSTEFAPTAFLPVLFYLMSGLSPLACSSDVHDFQVVFSLVEPAGDMYALPGDLIDANEWVRVFLRTGGMQHLLILLGKDGGIDPSQVRIRSIRVRFCAIGLMWHSGSAVLMLSYAQQLVPESTRFKHHGILLVWVDQSEETSFCCRPRLPENAGKAPPVPTLASLTAAPLCVFVAPR